MTQIVAALILAGGAFYGVYKGAVYAVDRLAAQLHEERTLAEERLDAEERRIQMQLNPEAARLSRQLAHDRRMRDLIELRSMLDEVATATGTAIELVAKARGTRQVSEVLKSTQWPSPSTPKRRRHSTPPSLAYKPSSISSSASASDSETPTPSPRNTSRCERR